MRSAHPVMQNMRAAMCGIRFEQRTSMATGALEPISIGRLCVAGDHACERGDLDALRYFALQLADRDEGLLRLAEQISGSPERATAAWQLIKERCLQCGVPCSPKN